MIWGDVGKSRQHPDGIYSSVAKPVPTSCYEPRDSEYKADWHDNRSGYDGGWHDCRAANRDGWADSAGYADGWHDWWADPGRDGWADSSAGYVGGWHDGWAARHDGRAANRDGWADSDGYAGGWHDGWDDAERDGWADNESSAAYVGGWHAGWAGGDDGADEGYGEAGYDDGLHDDWAGGDDEADIGYGEADAAHETNTRLPRQPLRSPTRKQYEQQNKKPPTKNKCGKFQIASQNKQKARTQPVKAILKPVAKRRPASGREQNEKKVGTAMLHSLADEHWEDVYAELSHGWIDDGGNEPPDEDKTAEPKVKRARGVKHRAGRKIQYVRFMRLLEDIQTQDI